LPEGLRPEGDDIVVEGKADLHGRPGVSGKTGEGVPELVARIAERLSERAAGAMTMTRERHRVALRSAIRALERTKTQLSSDSPQAELAADSLRLAIHALDRLVGRIDVETLLGEIFASFCIGK
jgi:tRNA modification GTPase